MNSSDEFSRKSLIGKTDLKTDCRPASSRSEGRRFICRKRSYLFRWISIRFGIGTVVLILEKSLRSRLTFLGRLYMRSSKSWTKKKQMLRAPGTHPQCAEQLSCVSIESCYLISTFAP